MSRTTIKIIGCMAMALSLQGCWFVFIPGSVVAATTDALTGAEGSNCVGAATKVGDQIRLPDSGAMQVKSLSGTSVRCTDPRYPIRALLVPSEATYKIGAHTLGDSQ